MTQLGQSMARGVINTAPPQGLSIVRSATQFNPVTVFNYGLLVPAPGTYDGTSVFYRNARDSGNAITNLEYMQGRSGMCPLLGAGQWFINCQTNIAAGTSRMVLYDFESPEAVLAMMGSLTNTTASTRTFSNPTFTDIAADAQIVAANAGRNLVMITHSGYSDAGVTASTADVWLSFNGATAVKGSGTLLGSKQTLIFDATSGIALTAIRGIPNAGTVRIGVQEAI